MIFHKTLVREFGERCGFATFFACSESRSTMQLVKLLGQAAIGVITSAGVLALLGFTLLNYLPVLLSLTTFIAVLMTLTRSYKDSEMVVWFSSGLGLVQWVRPVLAFALPLVCVIGCCRSRSRWAVSRRNLRRGSRARRRLVDRARVFSGIRPRRPVFTPRVFFSGGGGFFFFFFT